MLKKVGALIVIIFAIAFGYSLVFILPMPMGDMGMMGMGEMPPPAVKAMELQESPLDVLDEYIASVVPVQEVMVRTQVSGYVDAVHFQEGSMVQEGDLLFTIDQKQYRALVLARQAELSSAQAEFERSEKFLNRLKNAGERSVSQSDIDTAESAYLKAVAILKQAEANLNLAEIDLAYSEIRSPISGRIGAAMITKGNYVTSGSGELARIVQVDPIRVVFSMTDRAFLDIRQNVLAGETDMLDARVRLPNKAILPMIGKKEFSDNAMNEKTGTLAVRYLFDNPDELLVAGGYVNILLGKPERPMGLRIPQRAVLVNPEGSYVLTVTEEGMVGMAAITVGATIEADVEVTAGLKVGDRVIVDGVQKVQPGMPASVTLVEAAQ